MAVTKQVVTKRAETKRAVTKRKSTAPKLTNTVFNIHCSLTNTIATLTSGDGNVVMHTSGGSCGLKGKRQSTKHAAEVVVSALLKKMPRWMLRLPMVVRVQGVGKGKMTCIKMISKMRCNVVRVQEVTPVPMNGCRLARQTRKKRRSRSNY